MSSDSANLYKEVYQGLGSHGTTSTSIPAQAIPSYKKTPKWFEKNMDRFEEIGMQQIRKNAVFNEFYAMIEGDLAYTDYEETPEILQHVAGIRDRANLPSYVKHFDLIGQLGRHLASKYNDTKGKYRVDFLDPIAVTEYDREINNRVFEYTNQMFQLELQGSLAKKGINLNQQFQSQEEQEQFLQMVEQEKGKLHTPPQIKSAMDTQWKPEAAKWAEHTLEKDNTVFRQNKDEHQKFIDKYLTGRWFNHYRVSYDYYTIERWHPCETFFSEEADIEYPQDAEYIGNIQDMSPSKVVDTFGYMMKESDQKLLLNHYDYISASESTTGVKPSFENIIESNFTHTDELVPHKDYYDTQSTIELESALGTPLSTMTYVDSQGEKKTVDSWTPQYEFNNTGFTKTSKHLRRDIDGREDTLRVIQSYWRSWERVGLLYYESDLGFPSVEWVTDDLLDEFIKEHNITKLSKYSLQEFKMKFEDGTLEPNSLVFTHAPRAYKGIKIAGTNSLLKKDLYLGCEPLPFQIKGVGKEPSDLYKVKLPVTGIITTSEAKRLRPYQVEYNYQMNLMHSLTEKEIGIFWIFDIGLLPSDFEGMGDAEEVLLNVTDMARDIGMVPIDTSRQQMKDRSPQAPGMMAQDISFVPQIQQKMQLSEFYKTLLLEQIGVSRQDLGTPQQYSTAEGVRVGQNNSMAQVEHIFDKMDDARLKDMEVNLSVAQYCQSNQKDLSIAYMESTEGRIVREIIEKDENFPLRKFGLLPMADSKRRKELETFKQYLLNSNTFQNDLSDIAEVVSSDSFKVVNEVLKTSERKRDAVEQQRMQHEQQITERNIQAKEKSELEEQNFQLEKQRRELNTRIKVADIQNSANLLDTNNEDGDIERINEMSKNYMDNQQTNRKIDIEQEDKRTKNQIAMAQLKLKTQELAEKRRANDIKREAIKAKTFGDIVNKN